MTRETKGTLEGSDGQISSRSNDPWPPKGELSDDFFTSHQTGFWREGAPTLRLENPPCRGGKNEMRLVHSATADEARLAP